MWCGREGQDRLMGADVPCNVVAGYFHDHICVPCDKAEVAMETLDMLIRGE